MMGHYTTRADATVTSWLPGIRLSKAGYAGALPWEPLAPDGPVSRFGDESRWPSTVGFGRSVGSPRDRAVELSVAAS